MDAFLLGHGVLHSKILPTQSRIQHHCPATVGPPSQAKHRNLATGPNQH